MSKKKKSKNKNSYMARKDVPLENLKAKQEQLVGDLSEMEKKESGFIDEKMADLKDLDEAICKEQVAITIKENKVEAKIKRTGEIAGEIEGLKKRIKELEKEANKIHFEIAGDTKEIDTAKLDELKLAHSKISKKHDSKINALRKNMLRKARDLEKVEDRISRRMKNIKPEVAHAVVSPPDRGTGETFKRNTEEEMTNEQSG